MRQLTAHAGPVGDGHAVGKGAQRAHRARQARAALHRAEAALRAGRRQDVPVGDGGRGGRRGRGRRGRSVVLGKEHRRRGRGVEARGRDAAMAAAVAAGGVAAARWPVRLGVGKVVRRRQAEQVPAAGIGRRARGPRVGGHARGRP